jgi:hypothetical protein
LVWFVPAAGERRRPVTSTPSAPVSWAGGREMGHEALKAYTEVKAVTTQL